MKVSILVIGRNVAIMEVILRLINGQKDWVGHGAVTDEESIELFAKQAFDLVMIGGGVGENSEQKLTESFRKSNPAIKIIRHYGGGSGLLFNEIHEALPRPA